MTNEDIAERVLSAADDLYYRKGFAAVGMDELRTAAGVSLRRLYSLYPSKDDIISAVLRRKHEEWESAVEARVAVAGEAPRERLLAVYDYLQDWFCTGNFRGCAFINAFGELGGTNPAVAALAREHKQSFQRYMAGLARDLGATETLGAQLAILAEGAQSTAAIAGDSAAAVQARAAAEVLIDAALRPAA
ncbi:MULTISPECIES: TetR/AcrR family transcriptional regulator [unclassified Arthrobacter]|uniref:TetR/AcrR family transcriptional regulator n=1 Tax=unclassified Arthrobacter TaxID=235627 RepID=UPI001D142CC2|nr:MULTISPECIES: TetR/AcrR family transcriptional regulator [unclassified Arthrobacter]MCC3276419.1 TetR/AcrR family transcriptional regulator [Arthrobacter sp. zg-Y20]MCC3280330.1 TetR/AcrR family transcriptional regulator [Arthrobacter sp. zg-Y40]MCC9178599.1 TetR/AcrR family transcriptional regulator [Arthrobacter sp. zg-Y750]MDK1316578.1 TetR/AcrR family transcriptional regulator [Arthrobacter sp. zg.Y20]MDK1328729.1 TetR/AcrR family transcriptional regulator [Arthrobacter sp. zg-Y1143]